MGGLYEQGSTETGGADGAYDRVRRECRQPDGHTVHERPELERHELPGVVPVGEFHEYCHGGRWHGDATPLHADESGDVDWLASDEWLAYDADVRESGPYDLALRVAADDSFGGGDVGVVVDDEPVARLSIEPTGGWYSWADVETRVELARGLHTVRLVVFEGGWKLSELAFE